MGKHKCHTGLFFTIILGIAIILSISHPLYSQEIADLKFDRIRVEDGLHNGIVYRIIQDGNGVMWFGLHDGIDRYNGYDFRHFELSGERDPGAYANTQVRSIFKLNENEFWISSGSDLFRYDLKKDKFQIIIRGLSSGQEVNQIQDLHISDDSLCYIATNQGMFIYDIPSGEIMDLTSQSVSILSIHPIGDILWMGTGNGIRHFDTRTRSYVNFFENEEIENTLGVIHALSFFTDTLRELTLIGTRKNGLMSYDHRRKLLREVLNPGIEFTAIRAIIRYRDYYLIGMDGNGLGIIDPAMNMVGHYVHDEDDMYSLSSDGIYDIHVDDFERIWISSYGGGVNVHDPNKKAFHVYRHENNKRNSLRNNVSRSILETDKGMIFGTAKGISMLDRQGRWRHIPGLSSEREPNIVLDMCLDSKGNVWLGTFGKGVEVRESDGRIVKRLNTAGNIGPGLSTDYIYAILEDSRQRIWMGGIRGGLMVYDPVKNNISTFNGIQNVHAIIETTDGQVMVGTLEGISFLKYEDGEYHEQHGQDTLLTSKRIRVFSIHESRPGEFWIGTEGSGLFRYDRATEQIENINKNKGLPSNIVYGILEADDRKIWLSTTAGLAVFDPNTRHIRAYTEADGISGQDFNYGAYFRSQDGTMYFGSQRGISYFNPEEIHTDSRVPEIVLTNIEIAGIAPDDPESPVYELNINETDGIQLKHNQNSFTIEFAAINYTSTEKNLYQWRISGGEIGEGNWTPVSSERKAVFSYLPPGNYEFRVIASNHDGYWNNESKKLSVLISPPFWSTLMARVLYGVLIILLFIVLQRYILSLGKERQAKEKIQFFINVAHDIRTPLTLITAPMSKLISSSQLSWEEKEEVRIAVKNSDKLKSLLNQLLEFQKASLNKQVLKVAEHDIARLVDDVMNNFQPLMDERMINARLSLEKGPIPAWVDRQKIEKVLYNLISNAIKYSHKGGIVEVSVEKRGSMVMIRTKDEGRGIPARQQKDIFKRYFRAQNTINSRETGSGVGLMLSKKLMELHRGSIRFNSTENVGSEFMIEFPWERSAYRESEILKQEAADLKQGPEEDLGQLSFSQEYTVLVVEDNQELRHHLRNALREQYNVLTAKNGSIAYQTILKLDVDLIVSDLMMPEMDGRILCQKVRSNIATSHIPIILLTALNSIQDKIVGLEYGADDYIEKPFEMEYLRIRIANLLKSRERMRQRFLEQPDQTDEKDIPNKPDQELMLKLSRKVREEVLREDFSVKDMCRMVGMSRPVLYRKLKAYTGHSPQEYIIILRLNHASRLFREGHFSVKEVAYESGFTDPKYFSKSFKKHYGESPSDFIQAKGRSRQS